MHRALPVGELLLGNNISRSCVGCGHIMETQRHCLWDCSKAQGVWRRVLRILAFTNAEDFFTWGSAIWAEVSGLSFNYEMESTSHVIFFRNGQPMLAPTISCGHKRFVQ